MLKNCLTQLSTRNAGTSTVIRVGRRPLSSSTIRCNSSADSTQAETSTAAVRSLRSFLVIYSHAFLQSHEGWLFVDSVFPVRLGSWEYVLSFASLKPVYLTNLRQPAALHRTFPQRRALGTSI